MPSLYCYNLYACETLRRPPVGGQIVDADTGKPVAGAEVCVYLQFSILMPVETADSQGGRVDLAKTDAQGRFFLRPRSGLLWLGDDPDNGPYNSLFGLYPGKWTNTVVLWVYSPALVTSELRDDHPRFFRASYHEYYATATRTRLPLLGYYYTIQIRQAKSEADWEGKCHNTINAAALGVPRSTGDRWLFNDLTGYLEKWPDGEKAGEYMYAALKTGLLFSPDRIKELMREGKLTSKDLKMYRKRNEVLLDLSRKVNYTGLSGIDKPFYEHQIDQLAKNLAMIDSFLLNGGAR